MSDWRYRDWYRPSSKKPPPEHGIRVKKAGTTWWGQRWTDALEKVLQGQAGRLARGKTYARAGRTHDLTIQGGTITAKVTGSRETPYDVSIELAQLEEAAWKRAIAVMASKAQFSAELLAGQMPQAIDDAFVAAGASLFPQQRSELKTSCSCPDSGDPCKHVAATHYVLGEALDRDPFLLFELRGKTKTQVLAELRAARGTTNEAAQASAVSPTSAKRARKKRTTSMTVSHDVPAHDVPAHDVPPVAHDVPAVTHDVPTVALGKLKAADYDRPRGALPSLRFSFDEPAAHGAVLRQLGVPVAWQGEGSPAEALAPLVRAAADKARQVALSEPGEPTPSRPPEPLSKAKAKAPRRGGRTRGR